METADCIKNIDEIAAVPGVDMLFLGQNDLCMSMGLFEKYKFPDMYTSPELQAATDKLRAAAKKNNVILGLFLFGTSRVGEFLEKGFPFISVGNDLHHILTQAGAYVKDVEAVSKEKGKAGTAAQQRCFNFRDNPELAFDAASLGAKSQLNTFEHGAYGQADCFGFAGWRFITVLVTRMILALVALCRHRNARDSF